ncbi:MAG: hypothetical protein MJ160_01675 [Treponema sp.]|nr:hypothetical protein [Treponema sp.]
MTKGEINRIGKNLLISIQTNTLPSEQDLLGLQQYRKEFKDPLKIASNELLRIMNLIDNEGIVTYRVKRIESILSKIERQPDMDLARVNDIAGCRCILQNEKKVFQFLDELRKSTVLEIVKKNNSDGTSREYIFDYINEPKKNGYKSIHVICKCIDKLIEIQIRDNTQHAWATLVEITDSIYKTKIKEKDDDGKTGLYEFLRLYSKSKNLTREERKTINITLKKNKYLQKLSKTFSKNLVSIRKDWCDVEDTPGNFYLFELPKNNKPKFQVFDDFSEAEDAYFNSFTTEVNQNGSNIVMAYVQNKDFATVSKAYANYFLVKHTLFDNLINILSNDTKDKRINHNSFALALMCVYCRISININELEGNIINQISHSSKKYEDWLHEITQDIKSAAEKIHPKYRVRRSILIPFFLNILKIFIHLFVVILKIKLYQITH